jgi:hypothetical protein
LGLLSKQLKSAHDQVQLAVPYHKRLRMAVLRPVKRLLIQANAGVTCRLGQHEWVDHAAIKRADRADLESRSSSCREQDIQLKYKGRLLL